MEIFRSAKNLVNSVNVKSISKDNSAKFTILTDAGLNGLFNIEVIAKNGKSKGRKVVLTHGKDGFDERMDATVKRTLRVEWRSKSEKTLIHDEHALAVLEQSYLEYKESEHKEINYWGANTQQSKGGFQRKLSVLLKQFNLPKDLTRTEVNALSFDIFSATDGVIFFSLRFGSVRIPEEHIDEHPLVGKYEKLMAEYLALKSRYSALRTKRNERAEQVLLDEERRIAQRYLASNPNVCNVKSRIRQKSQNRVSERGVNHSLKKV